MGVLRRLAAILVLCLAPLAAHASDMQRMVLVPGCHLIAPGSFDEVSAYCLDQARAAPAPGARLAETSAALGETVAKLADGRVLGLRDAIQRQMIAIEGLGNQYELRVRNLTANTIELCVNGPTVVMGNGETYAGDLSRIRALLKKLIPSGAADGAGGAAPSDAHAAAQEKIWEAVNRADRQENDDLSRAILLGPMRPPMPPPPLVLPGGAHCATPEGRASVCIE